MTSVPGTVAVDQRALNGWGDDVNTLGEPKRLCAGRKRLLRIPVFRMYRSSHLHLWLRRWQVRPKSTTATASCRGQIPGRESRHGLAGGLRAGVMRRTSVPLTVVKARASRETKLDFRMPPVHGQHAHLEPRLVILPRGHIRCNGQPFDLQDKEQP